MKTPKYFSLFALTLLSFLIYSCNKDTDDPQTITSSIKGTVQKGPFLNGSSVTINELNLNFAQTGASFSTQTIDEIGNFQINNISLASPYVLLKADGFYFNEICGKNSDAQLTLNSIVNSSSRTAVYINVLTDLEKPRVEHLLSTGLSFDSAKAVAQNDVLNIFNISSAGVPNSEYLDISNSGNGNAILLAVSAILQGFRSESELTTLLASIRNDIALDGVLNSSAIKSQLIDHAILLDTLKIRNQIHNFYTSLGIVPSIPNFEFYIRNFIDNSNFTITNSAIHFPSSGSYGDNILNKSQLSYIGNGPHLILSMNVEMSECNYLKVRLHMINGTKSWSHNLISITNWHITAYDPINKEQFYTLIDPTEQADIQIHFDKGGTYQLDYYEINSLDLTYSKVFTVN